MLELGHVSLRFSHEDRTLLDDVSLTLGKNEWVGLTGPSGGGKTLIGLVAAGVIPDLIHADVGGSVHRPAQRCQNETAAAIVFQDPSFQLLSRTVRDELLYTPRQFGWPSGETAFDMERIVTGLDIESLLNRHPRELSMGEVQRVAVAAALMQRPRLLIMDEPTQYQDRYHVAGLLDFVADWTRRTGTSVMLIEHHAGLLSRFCARTYMVENGHTRPVIPFEPTFPVNGHPVPRESGLSTSLDDVSFHYTPGTPVLRHVTMSVSCGESVALLGPNGSGKSTLARIMCGLLNPVSGEVTLFGKPRTNGSWFRHIGYVMQNPDRQIFAPTVRDECAYGPRNFGIPPERWEGDIERRLGEFGLEGFEGRDPLSLSYGEKRRMNIIGVAAYDPQVLILDEPTSGLDYGNRLILLDRIRSWNAGGRTVIVITHDYEFARAACRRAVLIEGGQVVDDLPIDELRENDVVSLYST